MDKWLAEKILPYLESYDLVGTGDRPSKRERDDINYLMRILYDITETPTDARSSH